MQENVKTRYNWIDNLKLFACYGVLLGHCYSLFIGQVANGQERLSSFANAFLKTTSFIYNGDMWVIVFCMLSGYLLASKHFSNLKELLVTFVKRYFRFVEPLALLAIFIVLIKFTVGFKQRSSLVANEWIGLPMTVNLGNLLKMVFLFDPYMDNPLWTMRGIFAGGILIYILNYLMDKVSIKRRTLIIFPLTFILFCIGLLYSFDVLVCSCVLIGGGTDV